jgi:DNA polymerase III delta subunit
MLYLFTGQDNQAKDSKLNALKEEFLPRSARDFNLDILYARDLKLSHLQERLKSLPFKSPYRIVVIKEARHVKEDVKEFLAAYAQQPYPQVILVLDMDRFDRKSSFLDAISGHARVLRFQEEQVIDTFVLNRNLAARKTAASLRMLNHLLRRGEKPEKILGGLRYIWQKDAASPQDLKRRLKLLLACDMEIKTGRLKPACALEKLVVTVCSR